MIGASSLVLPLTFEAETLGVVVFERALGTAVYEMLRGQISVAVKNVALHREIVNKTALHERSVQERRAATERMKSLSVLAGGVAHDLNNALGPLVALPDIILRELDKLGIGPEQDGGRLRSDVATIKTAAQRATQTIKDLMTLGRHGQTQKGALDLNRAVAGCLTAEPLLFLQQEERKVEVELKLRPGPLVIHASQLHVERAISNLVRNAAEAITKSGRITVSTSLVCLTEPLAGHETVAPGEYAVVSVSDTGEGIEPEQIGRVFEPFFTKKKLGESSGSGLGSAIVHGVVREHHGYIDVASTPGSGTTFTLYLPTKAQSLAPTAPHGPSPGGHAKILVIDDEPSQLGTAHRVLTSLGYQVTTLGSGAQACSLFAEAEAAGRAGTHPDEPPTSPYDLVILDLHFSEPPDGLQTLEQIRRHFPDQRGIIASGHAPTEHGEPAAERGVLWLAKPYTADALARAVQEALSQRK